MFVFGLDVWIIYIVISDTNFHESTGTPSSLPVITPTADDPGELAAALQAEITKLKEENSIGNFYFKLSRIVFLRLLRFLNRLLI